MDVSEIGERRLRALRLLPLLQRLRRLTFAEVPERFTKTQLYILITLYAHDELTMTQLAKSVGASKEQATRAVAPLVDEGLAERFISPENRTRVHVRLSQTGKARMQELLRSSLERLEERMADRLSPEERETLREYLTGGAALLEKLVAD